MGDGGYAAGRCNFASTAVKIPYTGHPPLVAKSWVTICPGTNLRIQGYGHQNFTGG